MPSDDLKQLRARAHHFLLAADHPQPTSVVARCLFGERRHELPEAQAVVRALLTTDPRFIETHERRWTARGCHYLRRPLEEATFAIVDLETTGSIIGVDETIEIGIVVTKQGAVVERFSSLVWADRPIPPWVRRLTGIGRKKLLGAPRFDTLAPTLFELIDGAVFVAHDIRFDLPFLTWEFAGRGLPVPQVTGLCTLRLSQVLWPELSSHSLPELSRQFGIVHDHPHRALADAAATADILANALAAARRVGVRSLGDLYSLPEPGSESDWQQARLAAEAAES